MTRASQLAQGEGAIWGNRLAIAWGTDLVPYGDEIRIWLPGWVIGHWGPLVLIPRERFVEWSFEGKRDFGFPTTYGCRKKPNPCGSRTCGRGGKRSIFS